MLRRSFAFFTSVLAFSSLFLHINVVQAQIYREPANSQNPCGDILDGMNVLGSDFYERMNAYQICAEQYLGGSTLPSNSTTTTANPAMCRKWQQAYSSCVDQQRRGTTPAGMAMGCEQWQQILENGGCI